MSKNDRSSSATSNTNQETVEQQEETPLAKQQVLLKESMKTVEAESYRMRRALDKNQLEEALKHAAKMLNELRTNSLSPKNYYELCMCL
jgi:hypothetical protein